MKSNLSGQLNKLAWGIMPILFLLATGNHFLAQCIKSSETFPCCFKCSRRGHLNLITKNQDCVRQNFYNLYIYISFSPTKVSWLTLLPLKEDPSRDELRNQVFKRLRKARRITGIVVIPSPVHWHLHGRLPSL